MTLSKRKALTAHAAILAVLVVGMSAGSPAVAGDGDDIRVAGNYPSSGTSGTTQDGAKQDSGKQSGQSSQQSGGMVDDSVITAKVKSALISDSEVKGTDINVKTNKGEVILSGMVDDQSQIDRAVQISSNIEGVKSVSNRLSVKK